MTEISNRHNIDNTGLVCQWPSEEVLAYLCMSQPDCFRGKRVIELGSGYGLAGLVIAAATEASEVVVSDENPQVVNCLWTVPCLLGFIVVAAELWHVLVAYSSKQVFSALFNMCKINKRRQEQAADDFYHVRLSSITICIATPMLVCHVAEWLKLKSLDIKP